MITVIDITKVAVTASRARTTTTTITSSSTLLLLKLEGEGVKEESTIPGGAEGNSTPLDFDGDTANGLVAIARSEEEEVKQKETIYM